MSLQDVLSQRILGVYSDQIQKANTYSYEWRTVHGKTGTFQRRYKIKAGTDEPKPGPPALGTRNTAWSAGLADRLMHGTNVNGIFYDNKGERIHLTKDQLEEAKKQHSQKSVVIQSKGPDEKQRVDKVANDKKNAIMEHASKKDPLYLADVKKHKDIHDKNQRDEPLRKRRISLALESIASTNKPSHILSSLKSLRGDIKNEIDPSFTITTVNKDGKDVTVKRHLDDLITSFEKLAANLSTDNKVKIKKIDMDDMDQYSIDDFEMRNHSIDPATHKKIYEKINKKLQKDESQSE